MHPKVVRLASMPQNMSKQKKRSLKQDQFVPLYKLVPSIVTVLALCLGITSLRYAFDGKVQFAVALILFAALLDGVDGKIARFLNSTSVFGAHLDSIADMVSFGVAPALLMYLWALHAIPYKGAGWSITLIYISCAALRLARFNVQNIGVEPQVAYQEGRAARLSSYNVGIPMPAAALLCLTPMMLQFELCDGYRFSILGLSLYLILVSLLMVSTIPTFSPKYLKVKRSNIPALMGLGAMFISGMLFRPWIIIPIVAAAYLGSIPVVWYFSKRKE